MPVAKLKVLYLGQSDICAFYRTLGPLLRSSEVQVIYTREANAYNWAELEACDVVALPRAGTAEDLAMIQYAIMAGKPVWCDYDDYLFGLPTSNPAWQEFNSPSIQLTIAACLREATLVTVSTKALADAYGKHVIREYPVLSNALMFKPVPTPGSSKTLVWRGSPTHAGDIAHFAGQIAAGKPKDWAFEAFGAMPWPLLDAFMPGTGMHTTKSRPLYEYFKLLCDAKARVGVVPLQDCVFNRCKSNIAALEMLAAGVYPVVPDWEEWRGLGASYSPKTLKDALLVACSSDTVGLYKKALEKAVEDYALPPINALRVELLRRIACL